MLKALIKRLSIGDNKRKIDLATELLQLHIIDSINTVLVITFVFSQKKYQDSKMELATDISVANLSK